MYPFLTYHHPPTPRTIPNHLSAVQRLSPRWLESKYSTHRIRCMKVSSRKTTYTHLRWVVTNNAIHVVCSRVGRSSVLLSPRSTHTHDLEAHPPVQREWPLVIVCASLYDVDIPSRYHILDLGRFRNSMVSWESHRSMNVHYLLRHDATIPGTLP